MTSAYKIACHKDRLQAYLRGENIYPVTLELNLTAECNRTCPNCPSSLGELCMHVDMTFIHRLFDRLQGHTRGLIITGGEPALSPVFDEALKCARNDYRFRDIAVITNGTKLDQMLVAGALLEYASAVRVSLYDWDARSIDGALPTLRRIESLRNLVEHTGSGMEIGVGLLTAGHTRSALSRLVDRVFDAGAHWIYFHPFCVRSEDGASAQNEQKNALQWFGRLKRTHRNGEHIHFIDGRYSDDPVRFNGYHTAHFVLVVGADGMNYLGSEVKYRPDYAIADLNDDLSDDFLWRPARIEKINSVTHTRYPAGGGRNRGVLYNTVIERVKTKALAMETLTAHIDGHEVCLPHII